MMNIGANNYQSGPTRWAQPTWARQGAQARPGGLCPPRPTSGAHLLVYKSFLPRKIRRWLSGQSAAVLRRNLGRSTFALWRSDSAGGTSLLEGEIIVIIITNNSPILGRAISINIFNNTTSSQTLVHLLCSIFVPEPHIGTCGWLVVLITSCGWLLYGLFGGILYVQIHYAI